MRRSKGPFLACLLVCSCCAFFGCAQRFPSAGRNVQKPMASDGMEGHRQSAPPAKMPAFSNQPTDGSGDGTDSLDAAEDAGPSVHESPVSTAAGDSIGTAEYASGVDGGGAAAEIVPRPRAASPDVEGGPAKPPAAPSASTSTAPPSPPAPPIRVVAAGARAASSPGSPLVTIHVDEWETRKTLEIISRQANLNILVSPGVQGTVTLDLKDKAIDETLTAIARLCRLTIRRERDLIYVSTAAEAKLAEEDDLPVRIYRLNYVKSGDVRTIVQKHLSKKGIFTASPDAEEGLTSDAAKASAAENAKEVKAGGNSLAGGEVVVVQDYEHVLTKLDRIIAEIDVLPLQVMIEAVIVSVKLDKGMELGVNFALLDGAQSALAVAGSGTALNSAVGFPPAAVVTAAGKLAGTPISGFADNASGLKFGYVQNNSTSFVKALESFGEAKVLAAPRLFVLNKQRAEIHLGNRLGYATTTQTQTSTVQKVEFIDVGTQLRLRPFIASDGIIRLEIHPERSSGVIDTDGIPQINAAQVTTNVLIPDGRTLVIGGLIDDEVTQKREGLPFLVRLPWIGWLFGESDNKVTKKELIVMLTPRIWRPDCPGGLNFLGPPSSLGLDRRVSQCPHGEARDGPSLFEIPPPGYPCTDGVPAAAAEVGEAATAARDDRRAR